MRPNNRVAAEISRIHRLFTLGATRVSLSGATLQTWFGNRLTIRLDDGIEHSVGGLDEREATRVQDAATAGAGRVARALSPHLKRLDERLRQQFAGDRHVRNSDSRTPHEALAPVLGECKGLTRERLGQEAAEAVRRLAPLEPVDGFEGAWRRANYLFTSKSIRNVQAAALKTLRLPLTDEQAEAAATDEDATLVLAGAGTGKTAIIVGKVAHLVRNQHVSPDEVLVLAFNRKAADEKRGRLKGDLSKAHVRTFHSFGRRVIAESEAAPTLSKLAEDELALKRGVDTIVGELLNDPDQSKAVIEFIVYHYAPYRSAFEFDTLGQCEEYVRGVEPRTLSGVLVKSFEELEIANYLTEHGIEFRYQDWYETATATQQRRQYQPDFFLPDHNIYIEHFALDRDGRPPPGWREYAEGVEWKRSIHSQRGSTLVETYSWQYRQGVLLETLRRRLEEAGVRFEQVSRETLVKRLSQEQTSWLAGLLATFLNHVKSNGLSPEALRSRARQAGDGSRNENFLDAFEQVRAHYQERLAAEDALDFHDLINLATEHIREGRWKPQ